MRIAFLVIFNWYRFVLLILYVIDNIMSGKFDVFNVSLILKVGLSEYFVVIYDVVVGFVRFLCV